MDKTETTEGIERLKILLEKAVGRSILTPRDFDFLRDCIYARLKVLISSSTLKRVWGYAPGGNPRMSTYSTLASFLGYASWDAFLSSDPEEPASDYVLSEYVYVPETMHPGEHLYLYWQPDRECVAEYLGDSKFQVVESKNTRLKPSDTFVCQMLIEGEPLYLDKLCQQGRLPVGYVCGKISGVHFNIE